MILKAETIWPGRGRVIRDGGIKIEEGIVTEIAPFADIARGRERVQNLGNAILLPAFVNAHTHLDLSHLKGKTEKGSRFEQWLKTVAKARAMTLFETRSVRRGIAEVIAGGATAVGDISVSGKSAALIHKHGLLESVVFCEVLGFDPADAGRKLERLRAGIEGMQDGKHVRLGISPHAPYSVSAELFRGCAALARELDLPMAIHAAESPSEVEFLASGTGELRELLESVGMIPKNWQPPGKRPIHYLDDLGVLKCSPMLIHCYQVDESEAAVIESRGCSVAYCPRSNAFFRRPTDSLHKLLEAGVNVALGTDSLASNDSLSMLDEMRFVKERHPRLDWETVLEMGTINATRALGIRQGGVLKIGQPADITAIKPADAPALPSQILGEGSSVIFTMRAGRRLRKPVISRRIFTEA